MNSFESDLKRAIINKRFFLGVLISVFLLQKSGFDSDAYRMAFPAVAALPYTTAWLQEHDTKFVRASVVRAGYRSYIWGKFFACGLSGGLIVVLPCVIYGFMQGMGNDMEIKLLLIFSAGVVWSEVSSVLATATKSRYLAYTGGFVIYYLLVILYERYFKQLYCIYPYEWLRPQHTWLFQDMGIVGMQIALLVWIAILYYQMVRRDIENV